MARHRAAAEALAAGPASGPDHTLWDLEAGEQARALLDALAAEAQAQAICGATSDHKNAVSAFVAKEKPVFEGR